MEATSKITVKVTVDAPVEKVWHYFSQPEHVIHWNNASVDWHTPRAENDLKTGGRFVYRMEAKDQSFGFDFEGFYDDVKVHEYIAYHMADERKVEIWFKPHGDQTEVVETFDPETQNPIEMQHGGWQAILNNFKEYVEKSENLE